MWSLYSSIYFCEICNERGLHNGKICSILSVCRTRRVIGFDPAARQK